MVLLRTRGTPGTGGKLSSEETIDTGLPQGSGPEMGSTMVPACGGAILEPTSGPDPYGMAPKVIQKPAPERNLGYSWPATKVSGVDADKQHARTHDRTASDVSVRAS